MGRRSQPGCGCCAATSSVPCTGTLIFTVTICTGQAPTAGVSVTITQTGGGTYTATQTGGSSFTFINVPCGTYSYSVHVTFGGGITRTGTTPTVTSGSLATIPVAFTTPAGYHCGCCNNRWYPDSLTMTSSIAGTTGLAYIGAGIYRETSGTTIYQLGCGGVGPGPITFSLSINIPPSGTPCNGSFTATSSCSGPINLTFIFDAPCAAVLGTVTITE